MKLHIDDRPVIRTGDLVENTFTIKATRKAFAILSSGLYTNKPRAIIRELSCNAYDAHVAAGKTDVPFEVHLPTALDPQFYVKDFGTGLDDAGVMELYTTYFDSTKTDTNDQIGCMGLGSKSPFSYTQSFQIESRYHGVKRFYTCFINENGTPAITRLAEQETEEPNGLTVTLQIKREDLARFEQEARYALMYFTPKPLVLGRHSFSTYTVKHTIQGDNWKVRESDDQTMRGPYILQGFVPYPVDKHTILQHGISSTGKAVLELNIDMYVDLGQVEVQASREGLSYDKRTIGNVVSALEQVADELHATVQREFDKCASLWAARMMYANLCRNDDENRSLYNVFSQLKEEKPFTWRGKDLKATLSIDVGSLQHIDVVLYYKTKSNKALQRNKQFTPGEREKFKNKQGAFAFDFDLHKDLPILIDDLYGATDIIRQFLDQRVNQGHGRSYEKYALVLRPLSKRDEGPAKAEIIKVLSQLGSPQVQLASQLGFVTTRKSYYKKRAKNILNVWVGFPNNGGYRKDQIRRTFSKVCYTTREIDLDDGGFYLPVDRFSVMWKDKEMDHLDILLHNAVVLGILKSDDTSRLVALNEDEQKAAHKSAGEWINVFDYINSEFALLNGNHVLSNTHVAAQLVERLGRGMTSNIIAPWKKIRDTVKTGPFKTFVDEVLVFCADKTEHKVVFQMMSNLALETELEYCRQEARRMLDTWAATLAQYKMLYLIDWNYLTSDGSETVLEYINTIEELRAKS